MMRAALAALLIWAAGSVSATECAPLSHEGNRYTVCEVDMARDDLRLFLRDGTGTPYGDFRNLAATLAEQGQRLGFATNAGMYHEDRRPVGHYLEDGNEEMRVVTNPGPGNFGMLPNGVFCIRPGRADIIESRAYASDRPGCTYASQSGPMLVIDGALHPRFLPDSTYRNIRNGVGTSADGRRTVFAISDTLVTFHEFGRLFRDALGLPNALYFDGRVSRLYAPALNREDGGPRMGPIVGTVEAAD